MLGVGFAEPDTKRAVVLELFGYGNIKLILIAQYLILRSLFLPLIMGAFLMIAGLAYWYLLRNRHSPGVRGSLLSPDHHVARHRRGGLANLLAFDNGVNPGKWKQQASVAGMHA